MIGVTWIPDNTKKFAYKTFSLIPNAVDPDGQTAAIAPGSLTVGFDSSSADWQNQFSLVEMDRTAIEGDTVAINFGNFLITLVVDQSGSMTWNDNEGTRFDFLEGLVNDIDSALTTWNPNSTISYSLIQFKGRRISNMTIGIQGSQNSGLHFDGVYLVRKIHRISSDRNK